MPRTRAGFGARRLSLHHRSILYIAAEYRVAELEARNTGTNLEARHASGYFDRVSVGPSDSGPGRGG